MARLLVTGRGLIDPALIRGTLDAAWTSVPEHQQISLLPWIGWAEVDYAAAVREPLAREDELQRMRELLDASRITDGPPDLAGGFALTQGDRLLASSQTVRPACFLAWAVREPALTPPDEFAVALGRVLETCRFIVQLSVRDTALWSYRNAARARGGLRAATWDVDQPVPAQVLGLVTLVETLESINAGN